MIIKEPHKAQPDRLETSNLLTDTFTMPIRVQIKRKKLSAILKPNKQMVARLINQDLTQALQYPDTAKSNRDKRHQPDDIMRIKSPAT